MVECLYCLVFFCVNYEMCFCVVEFGYVTNEAFARANSIDFGYIWCIFLVYKFETLVETIADKKL